MPKKRRKRRSFARTSFTAEQKITMVELRKSGMGYSAIGRQIGRPGGSVTTWLKRYAITGSMTRKVGTGRHTSRRGPKPKKKVVLEEKEEG